MTIDQKQLDLFKKWFTQYTGTFQSADPDFKFNIGLKIDHTWRVCAEIRDIGRHLGLKADELTLAETLALFHDLGRFEQYARYATFADYKSTDHAELGVQILRRQDVLAPLPEPCREFVLKVVSYHNRAGLPADEEDKRVLFYSKLLRDADKIDIWRIVTELYLDKNRITKTTFELDLPDSMEIAAEVFAALCAKRIVKREHVRSLTDFKLLQIGWLYDVNFSRTFRIVEERDYLGRVAKALPATPQIKKILDIACEYLTRMGR